MGPILIYPHRTRTISQPNIPLPSEEKVVLFALLRNAIPPTLDRAAQLSADNLALYERALAIGGTGYAIDAVPSDKGSWKNHFGPQRWGELRSLKAQFDPHNILTPRQRVFH